MSGSNGEPVPQRAQLHAVVDSISAEIALCDEHGVILWVNESWRRSAESNTDQASAARCGTDYAALLREAAGGSGSGSESLRVVAAGLPDVLAGRVQRFQSEYQRHDLGSPRWFVVTITRVEGDDGDRVMVVHEDITAMKVAETEVLGHSERLADAFSSVIEAIARLIEKRDPYTAGHQRGAVHWCNRIADEIDFDADRRHGLLLGAGIHDIGKIAVPAEILTRPGRLSPLEMEMIRGHAAAGYEVLRGIEFPWSIADMVHQHHENFDGSGYPLGLAGEEICIEARIIAVADMFDAMTSHRPYRAALDLDATIEELRSLSGRRYDPLIVDAMLRVIEHDLRVDAGITELPT